MSLPSRSLAILSTVLLSLSLSIPSLADDITTISQIQGQSHYSPFHEQSVKTQGTITALSETGFYLQDPRGDGQNTTSDAMFIKFRTAGLRVGMSVSVEGEVKEEPVNDPAIGLTRTTLIARDVTTLSERGAMPSKVILGQADRPVPNRVISGFEGNLNERTELDLNDGLDFYESLEGMLVEIPKAQLTGPGTRYGDLFVVADGGTYTHPSLNQRKSLLISVEDGDFNPEIIQLKDPQSRGVNLQNAPKLNAMAYGKGDQFKRPIRGILDFNTSTAPGYFVGGYFVYPLNLPEVEPGGLAPEKTALRSSASQLTVASYNIENHSGVPERHNPDKTQALAKQIIENLAAPDILFLQEVGDNDGFEKDSPETRADQTLGQLAQAIEAAGGPKYQFIEIPPEDDQEGGKPNGNIRVAYLYQPARVQPIDKPDGSSTKSVNLDTNGQLSHNPGRLGAGHPAFNGGRKSLVAEFRFGQHQLVLINNHLKSKRGDSSPWSAKQPPVLGSVPIRVAQAQVIQDFVKDLQAKRPGVKIMVAGDMNDFYAAKSLRTLGGQNLTNLLETLPFAERWSYIYKGSSQSLDHLLVSKNLLEADAVADMVHINAEFTEATGAASDHDPLVARFNLP